LRRYTTVKKPAAGAKKPAAKRVTSLGLEVSSSSEDDVGHDTIKGLTLVHFSA
jgi:hypothetical protein